VIVLLISIFYTHIFADAAIIIKCMTVFMYREAVEYLVWVQSNLSKETSL
jgi:hypothetical protein